MLFTDNMMLPAKVEHPYAAETMMNYVYEPEVAAVICAYVNYISPVEGVQEILEKTDPKLAENPLIFPPDDVASRQLHPYPALSPRRRAQDAGGDGAGDRRLTRCCGSPCSGAARCCRGCSSAPACCGC